MKKCLVLSVALLLSCGAVASASISWLNPSGNATDFSWANGQNLTGNFGSPMNSGNSLIFLESNFDADSSDGSEVIVDDVLDVDLTANAGKVFVGVQLVIYGDYSISDPVSSGANSVEADFAMDVTSGAYSSAGGAYFATSTPGGNFWNDSDVITISPAENLSFLHLTVDGSVIAISDGQGGASSITVSNYTAFSLQPMVPEPASLALLAIGGLAVIRRR